MKNLGFSIFTLLLICSFSIKAQFEIDQHLAKRYNVTYADSNFFPVIDSLSKKFPKNDTLFCLATLHEPLLTAHQKYERLKGFKDAIKKEIIVEGMISSLEMDTAWDKINVLGDQLMKGPYKYLGYYCKATYEFRKNKSPQMALIKTNSGLAIKANCIPLMAIKGECYMAMKLSSSAILYFEDVVRIDSLNPTANRNLALLYYRAKLYKEAVKYTLAYKKKTPNDPFVYELLASAYSQLFQIREATNCYLILHKALPQNEQYLYGLMVSYHKLENMDSLCLFRTLLVERNTTLAQPVYQTEIKYYEGYCDTSKAEFYFQRGIAAFNRNELEQSLEWYDRGKRKFPKSDLLWTFQGNTYMKKREYENAIKCYEKCLELAKENNYKIKESWKEMGTAMEFYGSSATSIIEAYAELGDEKKMNKAIADFNSTFGSITSPLLLPTYYRALGLMAYKKGKYSQMMEYYQKGIQAGKNNGQGYPLGIELIQLIYLASNKTFVKNYNIGVSFRGNTTPLISKRATYTVTDKSKEKIGLFMALDIARILKQINPGQLEAYIMETFIKRDLNLDFCNDVRQLRMMGVNLNDSSFWDQCK